MYRRRPPFWFRSREVIGRPRLLVIHHTANPDEVQADQVEHNHEARGYDESVYGSHIAYHFLVGKSGEIKQNRAFSERSFHTKNQSVNLESIAIVVAGNFDVEEPTQVQLDALKELVAKLDSIFHFERIMGHRHASPTACPGKKLLDAMEKMALLREPQIGEAYSVTRYYSPVPGQPRYYRSGTGAYIKDVEVNCGLYTSEQIKAFRDAGRTFENGLLDDGTAGDCYHTADGTDVRNLQPFTMAACPPNMPLGTRLHIEGVGEVVCRDRGGSIKNKRLDLWTGVGNVGLQNIYTTNGGLMSVQILPPNP